MRLVRHDRGGRAGRDAVRDGRPVEPEPDDVIVAGMPGGVGFRREPPLRLRDGDRVEAGIGVIAAPSHPVVAERA